MSEQDYYIISRPADPSIIGVKNGLYQVKFDKDCFESVEAYEKHNNFFYTSSYYRKEEKFLDVTIDVKQLHLLKSAKLTDVMGICPGIPYVDFLISEKLKKIFKSMKLQKNLMFETNVIDDKRGLTHLFHFFYCPSLTFDNIILEKSELYTRNIYHDGSKIKIEDTIHKIKNKEHYEELKYSLLAPQFSKLCIDSKYENLDLIDVGGRMFISTNFKKQIEEQNITGLMIGDRCELVFNK